MAFEAGFVDGFAVVRSVNIRFALQRDEQRQSRPARFRRMIDFRKCKSSDAGMVKPIAEIRKPEIIAAAFRAIAKQGLPMPSYDLIAQEADMSRQLIRHYFPEPERLMVAVCDHLAATYRDCLMKGIIEAKATERLPMFLDFYFGVLAGRGLPKPSDDAVYDAMFALAVDSDAIRRNLHDQYNLLQNVVSHEVQISNPRLNQKACNEIGYLFVIIMYGHWKMVATLGFSDSYSRVARQAIDRVIESYNQRYDDPDLEPAPEPDTLEA